MSGVFFLCILIVFGACINVEAARILSIYPCPSISHQIVFRPITDELIKRGHQVTVLTTDPMYPKGAAPKNLTEIDVHDVSYNLLRKFFYTTITGRKSDFKNHMKFALSTTTAIFEEQMKTREVQDLIKNRTEGYDLIILESIYLPDLAFSHIFKAPTILISSFGPFIGVYDIMGVPIHPILYPNMMRVRFHNLTFWEKINELYTDYLMRYYQNIKEEKENGLIKKYFGPDTPSLNILKNNVDMLFINVHSMWEGNFPVPPNVIHFRGLHQKPPKSLPKDLQEYLDASGIGVIYVSFGTNVKTSLLPPEKLAIFEKVFSQLPYNVIWKRDDDTPRLESKNVKIFKWLPQADLLRHPNIKLFVTQGGLQSTDEAITAGVPLVGIPMLGDQWYNVEKYVYYKIGEGIDFEDVNENLLKKAIMDVAENDRYRENIVRLRSLMDDQLQNPLERAIWWIEYVLKHGGAKHLRAPAANLSWTEYYPLDVISFFLFLILLSTLLITYILLYVSNKYTQSEKLKIN